MGSRSRRRKLEAMARDTSSPHEAAIARRLLVEMGPEPVIPPPPPHLYVAEPFGGVRVTLRVRTEGLSVPSPFGDEDG